MAFSVKSPALPSYLSNLTNQDQQNIGSLLNPNAPLNDANMNAAQGAVANGMTGGGSAVGAGTWKLRDNELAQRFAQGHAMLEPYSQRQATASLQTQDEAARLQQIATQGQQAMDQLKLQESGQSARQSEAERAQLQQLAQQGAQAFQQLQYSTQAQSSNLDRSLAAEMARLGLTEQGQNTRQQAQLGSQAALEAQDIASRERLAQSGYGNQASLQAADLGSRASLQQSANQAALEEQILRGQQSYGQNAQSIQGNLANTLLSHYYGAGGGTGSSSGGGTAAPPRPYGIASGVDLDWVTQLPPTTSQYYGSSNAIPTVNTPTLGTGTLGAGSTVQNILRQYGFQP